MALVLLSLTSFDIFFQTMSNLVLSGAASAALIQEATIFQVVFYHSFVVQPGEYYCLREILQVPNEESNPRPKEFGAVGVGVVDCYHLANVLSHCS